MFAHGLREHGLMQIVGGWRLGSWSWLWSEFLRREHRHIRRLAEVCFVSGEDHVRAAAFGGAELQRVFEIVQSVIHGAKRIGVTDRCDRADAEQVAKELDGLFRATITPQ